MKRLRSSRRREGRLECGGLGRYLSAVLAVCLGSLALAAWGPAAGAAGKVTTRKAGVKVSGPLTFDVFGPFSGANAAFGPTMSAGCVPAVNAINRAGGVLGDRHLVCKNTNTRGDPADAVPLAQQLILSTAHLAGVIGPTGASSESTIPLFNRAHIVMFPLTGGVFWNTNHYPYFWRITPPDNDVGIAMALYARKRGFTRAAAVFGTTISAAGAVPTLVKTFRHLGGKIVVSEAIPADQPSYQSEVAKLMAAHPQVIFTEAGPVTSSTYFGELAQAHGLAPIIGTDGTVEPGWIGPVSKAIGGAGAMKRYYTAAQPYAPSKGLSFNAWASALKASATGVPQPAAQWRSNSFSETVYDSVVITALAMQESKSVNPRAYNSYIPKIANASRGAVQVHSYAQGLHELALGKRIQYIGAIGAFSLNKYHNSPGGFEIINSKFKYLTSFSATAIAKAGR